MEIPISHDELHVLIHLVDKDLEVLEANAPDTAEDEDDAETLRSLEETTALGRALQIAHRKLHR